MIKIDLSQIEPEDTEVEFTILKKIERSKDFAKTLLWLAKKLSNESSSTITSKDLFRFFKGTKALPYCKNMLDEFEGLGLVVKVVRKGFKTHHFGGAHNSKGLKLLSYVDEAKRALGLK